MRFSFFGEGNDYEWSLTAEIIQSLMYVSLVAEPVVCEDAVTSCNAAQYNLIQ